MAAKGKGPATMRGMRSASSARRASPAPRVQSHGAPKKGLVKSKSRGPSQGRVLPYLAFPLGSSPLA